MGPAIQWKSLAGTDDDPVVHPANQLEFQRPVLECERDPLAGVFVLGIERLRATQDDALGRLWLDPGGKAERVVVVVIRQLLRLELTVAPKPDCAADPAIDMLDLAGWHGVTVVALEVETSREPIAGMPIQWFPRLG